MSIRNRHLFCCLDGLTPKIREEQRIAAIKLLDLLNITSVPILEEATQMVARFLDSPICIITLIVDQEVWIKAAFGLSSLGLMNSLATSRTIKREDSFCTYVVDSQQPLYIENTLNDAVFSKSILVRKYKIQSYLGVPLITDDHQCIGTLAVMNIESFSLGTQQAIEYLQLVSQWCLREIELNRVKKILSFQANYTDSIKQLQVLHQFGEELRNPLTSIMGMTSILRQGVFGTFALRQQEYLNIIHTSSQHLNVLLDELLNLTTLPLQNQQRKLSLVNLEMLCQKVIQGISPIASRKLQTVRCCAENSDVILPLDKDRIYQVLCYLIFSVLEVSPPESIITIHLSGKGEKAVICVDFPTPKYLKFSTTRESEHSEILTTHLNSPQGLELSRSLILSYGGTMQRETLLKNSAISYDRYIISLPKVNYLI